MFIFILKTIVAALIISFVSWLSGKKLALAGYLTALPLTTILAIAFTQLEWRNTHQTIEYAKSIAFAVPISMLFFIPFMAAKRFHLNSWHCLLLGTLFLWAGYFLHQWLTSFIDKY